MSPPSSSGASSSYDSIIAKLRNDLNKVLQERNIKIYQGGRWTWTYDRALAEAIQDEIDYYTALQSAQR